MQGRQAGRSRRVRRQAGNHFTIRQTMRCRICRTNDEGNLELAKTVPKEIGSRLRAGWSTLDQAGNQKTILVDIGYIYTE